MSAGRWARKRGTSKYLGLRRGNSNIFPLKRAQLFPPRDQTGLRKTCDVRRRQLSLYRLNTDCLIAFLRKLVIIRRGWTLHISNRDSRCLCINTFVSQQCFFSDAFAYYSELFHIIYHFKSIFAVCEVIIIPKLFVVTDFRFIISSFHCYVRIIFVFNGWVDEGGSKTVGVGPKVHIQHHPPVGKVWCEKRSLR